MLQGLALTHVPNHTLVIAMDPAPAALEALELGSTTAKCCVTTSRALASRQSTHSLACHDGMKRLCLIYQDITHRRC